MQTLPTNDYLLTTDVVLLNGIGLLIFLKSVVGLTNHQGHDIQNVTDPSLYEHTCGT